MKKILRLALILGCFVGIGYALLDGPRPCPPGIPCSNK